ncbi:MAG TPA: Ig-like domain-containing protein, partial [Longimicrobiales bacterium]|nr:Ig-like domain-containing protein [Longimicrobiales bacterium]
MPRVPPDIVSTSPAHLETIDPGAGPLVFQFDRRISEQGVEGAVRISPETGELRVDRGRDQIRVSVEGGWRPNTVYRVVLGAGVRDLFGNQRQYPTEVVFSTGPAITETALAGIVTDRISGQPVSGPSLRVEAVSMSDSTTYVETTDRSGVFAMRYLPQGNYVVRAYLDQNRNRRLDETEARAITATSLAEGDTTLVTLAILAPDSTPAQVVTATARDSTTIVVRTDDYMDPTVPLGVAVRVQRASDGADIPVDTILYPHQDAALTAALRRAPAPAPEAAAEDPPADTVDAPDAAAAASDTTAAGPGGAKEPESPLPVRELVVWLAVP